MRLRLPQKDFQHAATVVSALVGRAATPMPVLNNILIRAEKGVVSLEGTDIESQIVATIPGAIEREGRTTVEAARVASIVKLLPAGADVMIDASEGRAILSCDGNEYRLNTLPVEDFPEWTREEPATTIRLEQKALRYMLGAAQYAIASGKDGRRVLFGIQVRVRDNVLQFTATDGKKLSRVWRTLGEVEGKPDAELILPAKPAAELHKSLSDEGPVDIQFAPRQVFFRAGGIVLRTQSIDGKYPDCDAVIPKEFPLEVRFDRDRFLSAVRRAGVVASDLNRSILLKISQDVCEFQSMAHDIGSFNGRMAVAYSGEPVRVAFNCEYLLETMSGFADAEVRMLLRNSTSPVVFKTEKESERLSLLMPIKLTSVPSTEEAAEEEE